MKIDFNQIKPHEIQENVFKILARDWILITAGSIDSYNTMTACWGTFGELWGMHVCMCFIRPLRYTYEFMEKENYFSLLVLGETYRDALQFCGENSGRVVDKAKATGITPFEIENGIVSFEQSKLIITCNKIYCQDLNSENYIGPFVKNSVCETDTHRMYIGEIRSCYVK